MREIEIKAKLKDKNKVMKKLASLGCVLEKAVTQHDTVYAKNVGSLKKYNDNDVFLRIRVKNDGAAIFTCKKPLPGSLDKMEHETKIDSEEEMGQTLLLMGYKKAVEVNKTRIVTHYDGCEICIDDVKGLGSFIEMEKLAGPKADANKIQAELFSFFESLGINKKDRVLYGYDILMLEKKEKA